MFTARCIVCDISVSKFSRCAKAAFYCIKQTSTLIDYESSVLIADVETRIYISAMYTHMYVLQYCGKKVRYGKKGGASPPMLPDRLRQSVGAEETEVLFRHFMYIHMYCNIVHTYLCIYVCTCAVHAYITYVRFVCILKNARLYSSGGFSRNPRARSSNELLCRWSNHPMIPPG